MDDKSLFEDRFRKHQGIVKRMIGRYVKNDDATIDDLTQQTFIKAWIHRDSFQGNSAYSSWLCRIAINTTINHIIANRQRLKVFDDSYKPGLVPEHYIYSTPLTILCNEEHLLLMGKEISKLPMGTKEALVYNTIYGMKYEEVAFALKIPIGTVRSRIKRARTILKEKLKGFL